MTLLRQLDIHGFKSFANPTTFVFDRGITAIIGPNGSGKSNVAEALRWVLGEQQYSNLRGRRTTDIIFAGSEKRNQLGMAEATLTIDNSDGGLPIEFSEVTVTRRADRSGDSQYLVNGKRVRLKDIQQLTAPLGQAHTIIGQGLVDAVLSQRPDDRTGLFEHAAGITGLRLQATTAERGLAEAEDNAQRLRDILHELQPRVRSLARSAKQARDYDEVRSQLVSLQRSYYGALWRESEDRQHRARQTVKVADQALEEIEIEHNGTGQRLNKLRARQHEVNLQAEQLDKRRGKLEQDLRDARHQLELLDSETVSMNQRIDDLNRACAELNAQRTSALQSADDLAQSIDELQAKIRELTQRRDLREAATLEARKQREHWERELASTEQQLLDLSREIAELDGNISALIDRQTRLETDLARVRHEVATLKHESESAAASGIEKAQQLENLQELVSSAGAVAREAELKLTTTEEAIAEREREATEHERDLDRLRSRLELLERAYQQGEGLYAGVRTLLRAVRNEKLDLPGLIGTVAEVIRVPDPYDIAVEVALGGHLQDIIVEGWQDAEQAIAYLKEHNAGRATFQPLDTVSARSRRELNLEDLGINGIAARLIDYPDRIEPVIEQLLGRILVVDDLVVTRRILKRESGWTLVTRAGEIARPAGSVTGGSRNRAAGLLARERERRHLPGQIAKLEEELASAKVAMRKVRHQLDGQVKDRERAFAELDSTRNEAQRLGRQVERLDQDQASLRSRLDLQTRERARLQEEHAAARNVLESARERRINVDFERQKIQEQRIELTTNLADAAPSADEELSRMRIEIATAEERLRSTQRESVAAISQSEAAERAFSARRTEIQQLEAQRQAFSERREAINLEIHEMTSIHRKAEQARWPLNEAREQAAAEITTAQRAAEQLADRVRDAERERDKVALDLARARDEESFLLERIQNDLEIDEPEDLLNETGDTGETVEREIRKLRDRLRRMSAVGADVLDEYDEESTRLEYLTDQLADVDQAAAALREVLSDLRGRMATSFTATFNEVAKEFENTFQRLFGGGAARLSHEIEDGQPGGIDIVARPPGKRFQGLNQLSGGERALTAVALLVAIQRINPAPFCLLDEVDAALDESNVVRFRDEVRDLASSTQFIVITHNRGTIEGADTLYGITMGPDSVSRTVSLRLDQAIRAVEEDQAFESVI